MGTDFSRSAAISARTRFCAAVGFERSIFFRASRMRSSRRWKAMAFGFASEFAIERET